MVVDWSSLVSKVFTSSMMTLHPRAKTRRGSSSLKQDGHNVIWQLHWRAARQDQAQAAVEFWRRRFAEDGDVPDLLKLQTECGQVAAFSSE